MVWVREPYVAGRACGADMISSYSGVLDEEFPRLDGVKGSHAQWRRAGLAERRSPLSQGGGGLLLKLWYAWLEHLNRCISATIYRIR